MARKFLGALASLLSNWMTLGDHAPVRVAKSSAYTVLATDLNKLIVCTGTFTLSLTAAATLGAGFFFYVDKADAVGAVTIDPNSTELIEGLSTIALYGSESKYMIFTDGTAWYTLGRQRGWIALTKVSLTGQTLASLNISDGFADAEMAKVRIDFDSLTFSTSASVVLKVIKSAAAVGTGYLYDIFTQTSTTVAGITNASGANVPLSQTTLTTAIGLSGDIEVQNNGGTAVFTQSVKISSYTVGTAGNPTQVFGRFNQSTTTAIQGMQLTGSTGTIATINYSVMGFRA